MGPHRSLYLHLPDPREAFSGGSFSLGVNPGQAVTGSAGYLGSCKAFGARHSTNTLPRAEATSCACRHARHSPAFGGNSGNETDFGIQAL